MSIKILTLFIVFSGLIVGCHKNRVTDPVGLTDFMPSEWKSPWIKQAVISENCGSINCPTAEFRETGCEYKYPSLLENGMIWHMQKTCQQNAG